MEAFSLPEPRVRPARSRVMPLPQALLPSADSLSLSELNPSADRRGSGSSAQRAIGGIGGAGRGPVGPDGAGGAGGVPPGASSSRMPPSDARTPEAS